MASIAVIVVATGKGIIDIFHKIGASAVVSGGKTMNPSAKDVLRAIEAVKSPQIIILPNDKNIVLATQQVASIAGKYVRVLPTVTIRKVLLLFYLSTRKLIYMLIFIKWKSPALW